MAQTVFGQPENHETEWHEFGTGLPESGEVNPVFREWGMVSRPYLETPLTLLSGDALQTYDDGTVEQIRDGKVVVTTRWVSEKPDYLTDDILDAEEVGEGS